MFEQGKYKNSTKEEIKEDLESQGYTPQLISENPNDFLETHNHQESHILVVVEGEMEVKTKGKEIVMKPGDKITIGPAEDHAAYFGPEGCKYFWVEY